MIEVIYTVNGTCEDRARFETRKEADTWIHEEETSGEPFMLFSVESICDHSE